MATSYYDIEGSISVIDFSATIGASVVSSDKQKVIISYTGLAYPEKTDVALTTYQYSLDNGTTWYTMTPSSSTELSDLTFSSSGTTNSFEWEAKSDVGVDFYNITLRVRLRFTSGSDITSLSYKAYTFERITQNQATFESKSPFPDSYGGTSGSSLARQYAPKLA